MQQQETHSCTVGGRKERAVSLPDQSCLKVQEMQNVALEGRMRTVKQETFSYPSAQEKICHVQDEQLLCHEISDTHVQTEKA